MINIENIKNKNNITVDRTIITFKNENIETLIQECLDYIKDNKDTISDVEILINPHYVNIYQIDLVLYKFKGNIEEVLHMTKEDVLNLL